MTAAAFVQITPAGRISQARSLLAEIDATAWPQSAEAGIRYMRDYAAECVTAYGLIESGDMDPLELPVPDEWRGDDEHGAALEAASDQALQGARTAWKRLDEALRREAAVAARDGGKQ